MIDNTFDAQLQRLFQGSRYAARVLDRHKHWKEWLVRASTLPATRVVTGLRETLDILKPGDAHTLAIALRQARQQAMLSILFRDLNGLADLNEVVTAISDFADIATQAAVTFHRKTLAAEWGIDATASLASLSPQSDLIVIGMGKLGGHELNVSSDIDLIFVYPEDGAASANKSWHEFHAELGKRVIRTLDEIDENGFVFRVDMRLRPFGTSGPLVASLASLTDYFRQHARPWERYAWLKSRVITGLSAHRDALAQLVQPFVFRRYHDYAAIDEMRALHGQIRAEATKRGKQDDIKVGEGGIREVEFVAQLHQLIRGGRETAWQTRSTREALNLLAHDDRQDQTAVIKLTQAYTFLRNLEHRLQYLDDQQTQTLPWSDVDRRAIAQSMGFSDWSSFFDLLNRHRAHVTAMFDAAFGAAARSKLAEISANTTSHGAQKNETPLSTGVSNTNVPESPANRRVFNDDADALIRTRLAQWRGSQRMQSLLPKLQTRLNTLIETALVIVPPLDPTTTTIFRVFDLLDAIDKRETYLALLMAYPDAFSRATHLMAKSAWAADLLRRHPVLLDEFTRPRNEKAGLDWPAERAALEQQCKDAHGDVEKLYEILRHTKQVATLKLNIADIEGRLGVMSLSDELSWLADTLLDRAVTEAWRALTKDSKAVPTGFGVIGYGKLGSKELGYASDLDLVFVYDAESATPADTYARLAQRINSWLNTMTAGGVLYETDLRLRPDGASGLLVSSLAAFRDYQTHRAWTWEHQALTRARFCAGDQALISTFDAIRAEILMSSRDPANLKAEIIKMRDKMRVEKKDKTDGTHPLDLKNTQGGIVDVEFIVQYLILAYAHEHPEFTQNLGNFALLTRAAALGIIDEDVAAGVAKAYLAYRDRLHISQNNNERKAWIGRDELVSEREAVVRLWRALFAG
jgi:[glutamine synthetase] adenylyltransferase / [glutamine synthetase]-adenylyl-L-tyrosine phosphorylase